MNGLVLKNFMQIVQWVEQEREFFMQVIGNQWVLCNTWKSKHFKGNQKRSRKAFTDRKFYPTEIDQKILAFLVQILALRNGGSPSSYFNANFKKIRQI